jgi:hypothetical protein
MLLHLRRYLPFVGTSFHLFRPIVNLFFLLRKYFRLKLLLVVHILLRLLLLIIDVQILLLLLLLLLLILLLLQLLLLLLLILLLLLLLLLLLIRMRREFPTTTPVVISKALQSAPKAETITAGRKQLVWELSCLTDHDGPAFFPNPMSPIVILLLLLFSPPLLLA